MEDKNLAALAARPRPSIFGATLLTLCAAAGLWIASFWAYRIAPEPGEAQDTVLKALYYLLFVLLPMALYAARHRGLSEALRLKPMPVLPSASVIFAALLSVYAASALNGLWALMLDGVGLRAPETSLGLDSPRAVLLSVLSAAALPAVCEELLFRGFVFSAWESRGTRHALWVSALLFALLHGNLYGFPAYALVGAVSAFLVFSLDSVYAGIIYHTVYNAAVLVIVYLLSDVSDAQAAPDAVQLLSVAVNAVFTCGLLAAVLFAVNLRGRASGVEPVPRVRAPLRRRERAAMAALLLLTVGTTVAVLAGV